MSPMNIYIRDAVDTLELCREHKDERAYQFALRRLLERTDA